MRTPRPAHLLSLLLLGTFIAIGCNDPASPDSGVVRITLAVTGLDPDPDGYVISVDGAPASTLPGSGSASLDLDTGEHTIALEDFAANCATTGPSSHTLTVFPNETTDLAFAITCTAVTGIIEVSITTTGPDPDTDGYQLTLDAGASKGVLPMSLMLFAQVPGGTHSVDLTGSAPNCSPVGPNPVEVSVEVGGLVRHVAQVTISVSCTAMTGVIEVRAPTSGFDTDADGYDVSLDGGGAHGLPPNGVIWFTGVTGGTHSVSISHLAPNCLGAGANPQEVTVEVGGVVRDTAQVTFAVNCTSSTGAIRVIATTTGQSPDPAYLVQVDGGTPTGLATGATVVIQGLAPGSRSIVLLDVASNCAVSDPNPATASVVVGDTVDVQFNVTCTLEPRTSGADVVLTTTGVNPDDAYHLAICHSDDWYCYYPLWSGPVPANGTVEIELAAGSYYYYLWDVAENCSGGPMSGSFSVPSGQIATVPLSLVCVAAGTVVVSAPTSGVDIDGSYWVSVDGNYKSGLPSGSSVSLTLLAGTRTIGLEDIAPNCAVSGSNPMIVNVVAGASTDVNFPVSCAANPVLRATVTTTGPNAPASYLVGVDLYYDYYYGWSYLYSAAVPSTGEVQMSLPQGPHTVVLDQVPANCTVTSPNNVPVTLSFGATTDVVFAVTCT
jgi:hypothetical protein